MNKFKKITSLFLASACIIICSYTPSVSAAEVEPDAHTKELMELFPEFKESFENDTTGELVERSETYVKITEKSSTNSRNSISTCTLDNLDENYNVQYYTKEGYEQEIEKENNNQFTSPFSNYSNIRTYSIGSQEGGSSSWLVIDLEVYKGSVVSTSNFLAYNFCRWLTSPILRLGNGEGIGISVSSGMVISSDPKTRHACYECANPYSPDGSYSDLKVSVNTGGNGVLAVTSLQPGQVLKAFPDLNEYHNFMVSTGVSFNGSAVSKGWITATYAHKQIAIGSIGMNVYGVPSLSIGGSLDTVTASRPVSR